MRRLMPLPPVLEPPKTAKLEWERMAEEVIDARAQERRHVIEPPDRVVFGSVPRVKSPFRDL